MARVEGRVWWKRKKKGRKSREWATEGRERLRKKGEREKGRGREKRTETERRKKEISSGSGEKERNRKREGQRGEKGGENRENFVDNYRWLEGLQALGKYAL